MIRLQSDEQVPVDPRAAAVWWATRRQMGLVDPMRDEAFRAWWRAHPDHAAAWQEIDRGVAAMEQFADMPLLRAMRAEARGAISRARAARRRRAWAGVGAGVLAASLAAVLIWLPANGPQLATSPAAADRPAPAPQRYATRVGERRTIQLPDGTKVALNTGSVLEVAYRADVRDLRLLRGQALFQVAKDPNRPFVVLAGERRIIATGTAFDVRLDEGGGLSVLLVEGRVHVEPRRREGLARLVPVLARETLQPGERLSAVESDGSTKDSETLVAPAEIARATAWSRGQIIFRGDRLRDALSEVNRYSTTQLVIADPGIADLEISGVFPASGHRDFLDALQLLYPVKVEEKSPALIALKWRERPRL